MLRRSILFGSVSALAISGCSTVKNIDTGRDKLVAAETGFTIACNGATGLLQESFFKAGGPTALAINAAIESAYAALVQWRKSPDDPNIVAQGLAAIRPLIELYYSIQTRKNQTNPPPELSADAKRKFSLSPAAINLILQTLPLLLQLATAGFEAISRMIDTIKGAESAGRPVTDAELAGFASISDAARASWMALNPTVPA